MIKLFKQLFKKEKPKSDYEKSEIDKYVPDHCAYKLDNTFITSTDINKLYSQLGAVVAKLKDDFIQEEVLNRFMRRHHEALEKTSPTIPDKFGDNLHWGLLVVEQDPEQNISKEVFKRSWDAIISRIAIVETPWVQTILEGDGSITTNKGTDTRLHVYLQTKNPDLGLFCIEDRLRREQRKQRLENFLKS